MMRTAMMRKLAVIGALALLSLTGSAAADWVRFRGPNGNGIVSDKLTLLTKPRQLWTASVGGGNASLIVQSGRVYTIGSQRGEGPFLICLDANTGKNIWKRKLDAWSSDSSPTLAGDKGFVLCTNKPPSLVCFRSSDGETIWRKELSGATGERHYGFAGSPTLWRDLVIVNVGLGMALKQDNGEIVWAHEGLAGLATPVMYETKGQQAVMIFAGEALYAREARSGRELWSIPWKTELAVNACDPIYHEGKVFISTDYGKHAALFDVTTQPPRQVWRERGSSFSSGFLWNGHLFFFEGSEFSCFDLAGSKQWSSPHVGGGSALLAGDKVLLLSDKGRLLVAPVSTESFRPMLEAQIHGGTTWTPPSLANGRLLVRNKDGDALCLQIGE
jgi:outer membrane protein assembly factor BamB